MTGTSVTINTSTWPLPLRIELQEVIEELETKVKASVAEASSVSMDASEDLGAPSGWTREAYLEVIKKLLRNHHVQVAVIFEAIKSGTGYVSREQVYELGHYEADRSLKGFTRPVNRFTADAVEAGLLPEDADDLLAPDYDRSVSSYQRARGFRVPLDVVRMAEAWRAEGNQD